jgi:hypothetical protein
VTMQARDLLGNLVREVEALREELGRSKLNREVSRQSVSTSLWYCVGFVSVDGGWRGSARFDPVSCVCVCVLTMSRRPHHAPRT